MNSNYDDNFKSTRNGFTLVELLFVIAIIAVLGAMAAGILGKAQNDAKISATRARITQIEAIMQTVIEDFEVRRLPVRNSELASQSGVTTRAEVNNLRRRLVAAMLLAEFPGPQVDSVTGEFVSRPSVTGKLAPADAVVLGSNFGNFRSYLADNYDAAFISFLEGRVLTSEMAYWQSSASSVDQPGEYLYRILERINVDGNSALESLGPNVIGDTDEDGVPEIVDAFGDSMQLRLVQVAVTDLTVPANDAWTDVPPNAINWERRVPVPGTILNLPLGYEFLNPFIPRPITKLRFQVVSPNLEAIE